VHVTPRSRTSILATLAAVGFALAALFGGSRPFPIDAAASSHAATFHAGAAPVASLCATIELQGRTRLADPSSGTPIRAAAPGLVRGARPVAAAIHAGSGNAGSSGADESGGRSGSSHRTGRDHRSDSAHRLASVASATRAAAAFHAHLDVAAALAVRRSNRHVFGSTTAPPSVL
jgi:hypothetical protein